MAISLSHRFIVDSILPAREVHLLYGPITEDCRLLALYMLNEWISGRPVLGFKSHPLPCVYVSCDQSESSLRRAIAYMNIEPDTIPIVSLIGNTKPEDHNINGALGIARRRNPKLRVLVLDGFLSLCPGKLNDYRDASRFMRDAINTCQSSDITIIGLAPATKSKDGEGYISLRERMHGSTAFMASSSTKFVIEPHKPSKVMDPLRVVTSLPNISPAKIFSFTRAIGPLTFIGEGVEESDLNAWLAKQAAGKEIAAGDLRMLATQLGIPTSTLYNWIATQLELGTIVKTKHGMYTVAERVPS